MESNQSIDGLGCSKDSIKATAVKYDVGTVKSVKYGEASVSGCFLFLSDEIVLPKYEKQMIDKTLEWLNEMGLEKFKDGLIEKSILGSLIARTAPDTHPEKVEVYFILFAFAGLLDDTIIYLSHLNEDDPKKQQDIVSNVVENLISIIDNCGNRPTTGAAVSKVHPLFKPTCETLSYLCKKSKEQLDEDDYKRFMREIAYYIISQKWVQEYAAMPHNNDEYFDVRIFDLFGSTALNVICSIKGVRIPEDIRRHPVFQRYWRNILRHTTIINDILSLPKELENDESINVILCDCQTYSLQRSIYNREKDANDLIIALRKDQIRLQLYYPTNESLKKFLEISNHIVNGSLLWYQDCGRYGNRKVETCIVEYQCDYNSWLERINMMSVESMKQPRLIVESNKSSTPSIFV